MSERRNLRPRCRVCGRSLRSPSSIAKGMGPTCERKLYGVVRGLDASRAAPKSQAGCECVGLLEGEEDV